MPKLRWLLRHGLRIMLFRIGIHTCEASATAEGYVGLGVHRGARICAAGHGGQILVSQTTRDLLQSHGLVKTRLDPLPYAVDRISE